VVVLVVEVEVEVVVGAVDVVVASGGDVSGLKTPPA
jgi:hypothetical protein